MAEADKKFLITVLRALIISRKEATINDLCRDYYDTEGRQIPFREYGYKTIEDFLNGSNEIQVGRDKRIYVRSSSASNHIKKLVDEQNQPKNKRSARMIKAPAQRRFNGGGGGGCGGGGIGSGGQQNSYRSNYNNQRPQQNAYSTAYHQMKSRSPMKFPKNRSIPMNQSTTTPSPVPLSARPSFLITLDGGKYVAQPISNNPNATIHQNNNNNNNNSDKQRSIPKSSSEPIQNRLNVITIDNSNAGGNKTQQKPEQQSKQPQQQQKQPSPDRIVQSDNKVSFNNFTLIPSNDLRHRLNNKKNERKIATPSPPPPPSQQSILNFVDFKVSSSSNRSVEMPPPLPQPSLVPLMSIKLPNNNFNNNNIQPLMMVSTNDSKLQNRLKVIQKSVAIKTQENISRSSSSNSSLSSSPPTLQQFDTPSSKLNERLIRSQSTTSSSSNTITNALNDLSIMVKQQQKSTNSVQPQQVQPSPTQQSTNINEITHVIALAMYCRDKGYESPEYKIYKIQKTQRVQCRVMINNVTYSTYPDDYETVQIAKLQTARSALEQLKESEVHGKYPICMDPNSELAIKIYDCLKCSTHGMFSQKIPEYFQEVYQLSLPEHWLTIIMEFPQLFSIVDSPYKKIIYANETNNNQESTEKKINNGINLSSPSPSSSLPISQTNVDTINNLSSKIHTKMTIDSTNSATSPSTNPIKLSDSLVSTHKIESNYKYMDKLKLPWQEKYWNLFITNPKSTVEIWGRLIGPDYSDKMDLIIVDIELELMNHRNSIDVDKLRVGDIYLVVVNECCNRVRIDSIDMAEQRCLCFYIDIGDEEWFGLNELYECKPEFLKFPAQAICFCLFGLEDFAENPNSKTHLDDVLTNKTLVGDIASSQEEYDQQEASEGIEPKVQIALYDTSSEEDVNLNPVILDKICSDFVPVGLQPVGITNVLITNICDTGEVYCQLRESSGGGIHYVQKLIHHLTHAEFNRDQHRYCYGGGGGGGSNSLDVSTIKQRSSSPLLSKSHHQQQQLYLVHDAGDQKWYRAIFLEEKPDRSRMFYVDYGRERMILATDIYRLDSMSIALNRYPHQAILCRLHDVNEMTPSILSSLRGYLNLNKPAMIKIMGSRSTVPSVKIFIRFNEGPLFCINDSIQLEQEIETSPDIIDETLNSSIFSQKILLNGSGGVGGNIDRGLTTNPIVENGSTSKYSQMNQFGGGSGGLVTSKCPWPSLVLYNLPGINEIFEIQVTLASNPHHFKVRSHKEMPKFVSMMNDLQQYCSDMPNFIDDEDIEEGQAYACQQDDGIWYRVIVTKLFSQTVFMICYCDFGDIVIVQNNQLKELPVQFRQLPQLAITAKLYGITPRNQDWDTEDCLEFQKLTVDKKFVSRIDNILYESNDRILEMTVIDVSTSIDVNINELMLHDGRAIKV